METYTVTVDEYNTIRWHKEGTDIRHRLDGPAVEYANGAKDWYENGYLHRLDGPASICANGTKMWLQNSNLHRLDGPAIEWSDGTKHYYIDDVYLTEEEFLEKTRPKKELTVDEIEELLGYSIKIVK